MVVVVVVILKGSLTKQGRKEGKTITQLGHSQTICTSLQTDNHTNTSLLKLYRPDALPDAQPTV